MSVETINIQTIHTPAPLALPPTQYERKAKYIKSYLANKYDTDEAFRTKTARQRATNQFIKYNADPEYRTKILEKQRNAYQANKAKKKADTSIC
jgi:hypothetical protein